MQLLLMQMSGLNGTEPMVLILYDQRVRKAYPLCESQVPRRGYVCCLLMYICAHLVHGSQLS